MELIYPSFNPIALSIGSLHIGWYGLMYLFGFVAALLIGCQQAKRNTNPWNRELVQDAIFWMAIGVILGGRFGYIVFYNLDFYLADPIRMLKIWEGGMSFHGGLIGVTIAMALLARHNKFSLFTVADFFVPCIPAGLGFGRIGNFINSELWGKVTDSSFGMLLNDPVYGLVKRYPTQLLEALLEGLVLGIIVWLAYKKYPLRAGFTSGVFLIGYGTFRGFVEFYRSPDAHIGYLAGDWLTMGHLLSLPMIVIGIALVLLSSKKNEKLP